MSLKDKRQVRLRLTERLKNQYNVSVAEVGSRDKWQRLDLAIAYVALNQSTAEEMRDKLMNAMDSLLASEAEITAWNADII